ncbi:MAG: Rrf2 family transcriptional regulator [Deltaproteobacteria bacterium]|nr:Rrf2 family transcriptional regulator [Deltaproteobacteria bacterium]
MLLSQGSEYALRIAAYLALCGKAGRFSSREVAEATHVPPHYSSKILRKLVSAGILSAVRGKGGGFIVARAPSQIRFRDILDAVGAELSPRHCVFGLAECGSKNPCLLHYRWKAFNEIFQKWANDTTLADVMHDVDVETMLGKYRRMRENLSREK